MDSVDFTELLLETEFVWHEVSVGDSVMLDADLYEQNQLKLKRHHSYEVVAKLQENPSEVPLLMVVSDITDELVSVHPSFICSYQSASGPVAHS